MEEIVLLRHQSNLWLDGFRSRSKLVMIPTGFPMRLLPCLQFRPGCQQVAFTLTLLNTRGLDSSNRDVDHKSDATKLRWLEPSFSGLVIGRARSMLHFFFVGNHQRFLTIWLLLLFDQLIESATIFSIIHNMVIDLSAKM